MDTDDGTNEVRLTNAALQADTTLFREWSVRAEVGFSSLSKLLKEHSSLCLDSEEDRKVLRLAIVRWMDDGRLIVSFDPVGRP